MTERRKQSHVKNDRLDFAFNFGFKQIRIVYRNGLKNFLSRVCTMCVRVNCQTLDSRHMEIMNGTSHFFIRFYSWYLFGFQCNLYLVCMPHIFLALRRSKSRQWYFHSLIFSSSDTGLRTRELIVRFRFELCRRRRSNLKRSEWI